MSIHYLPTVTIAGESIAPSWDGHELAALGGMTLDWGREELYDDVRPTVTKLQIIDPDGYWATSTDRQGASVTISIGARDLFKGRVNEVDVLREVVFNPDTEDEDEVWIAELTLSDPLADLAAAVLPGPNAYNSSFDEFGDGYWPGASSAATRRTSIFNGGADDYVASIQAPSLDPLYDEFREYNFSDRRSLLDLIEGMYHLVPLGHVNYDPDTEGITVGLPASNPGLALVYGGGIISILPNDGYTLPANRLELLDDLRAVSTIANAVDLVQVNYTRLKSAPADARDFVEEKVQAPTSRYVPGATGVRILQIDTDLYFYAALATSVAVAVAAMAEGINGRFELPAVRYDFRRGTTGDVALDELLLSVYDKAEALYLAGSVFSVFPEVGASRQLIGGLLTWHGRRAGSSLEEGWTVDLRLAPTVGTLSPVTLATYVTNTAARLNEFSPEIRWTDLADVTIGAA